MRILAMLGTLAVCVGVTGCSRLEEATMPVATKINTARPVSPEVRSAEERLLILLADDTKAVDAVKAQAVSRMTLRALTCSKGLSIGRFDSVATVKGLPMSTPCFQEQDADLQKYFGIRTVGALLSKPPLRPLKAAGPIATLPKGTLSYITSGALARDAGVGVLRDGRGDGIVVEMPGAKLISQLPRVGSVSEPSTRVSPNGRVVVFNAMGQGPTFVDAETGNQIWTFGGSGGTRLLAWLPEVDGFVVAGVNGDVMLADGQTGGMEPHPQSIKNASYGAHIPGEPARLLMGTAREFVLVEHTRSPQGIVTSSVKQYTIGNGPGITSGNPVPMRSGHMVVYASSRDIGWLDLDSGASGRWRSSPLFGIPFAKLDESHIMFDSSEPGRMSLKPWSFDITNETVAPIDLGEPRGLIVDIGDRVGFLRRGNDAWFGDKVTTGEAQPLDKPVAAYELQLQLAKLQAQTSSQNGLTSSFGHDRGNAPSDRSMPLPAMPGLSDAPADAQVHMVGVYEGKSVAGSPSGRSPRNVRIVTRASTRPIVLVLASYEPVNWIVVNNGARVSAVLLSGYYPSTVSGVGNVPVLRIGSAYAYSAGSAEYARLRQAVAQYAGAREIRSFQGSYSGAEFSVGGQ